MSISAPTGLIGMFHERRPVLPDERGNGGLQSPGQVVHRRNQGAIADPQLFLQVPEGQAVDVMLHGRDTQQAIGE